MSAGVDGHGMPVAWKHRFAGSAILARFLPQALNTNSANTHSELMRAPFSATERFMSRTTNTSASVRAAKIQKLSK